MGQYAHRPPATLGVLHRSLTVEPTSCFCSLSPRKCEVLITAEVVRFDENSATILVLGEPHYDPDNILESEQVLYDLKNHGVDLEVGRQGLFRVHPPGACIEDYPDEYIISHSVLEINDGVYLCDTFPSFLGTSRDVIVAAVLSSDCRVAVNELGIVSDCVDSGGSCSTIVYSLNSGLLLFFLGFVVACLKKKKFQ